MTSSVTQASATFIRSTAHTPTVGVIAVVLLIVLLVERELLRAHDGRRARVGMTALAIPIAPLVLACAVTITLRVTPMLYPTPAAHAPARVTPLLVGRSAFGVRRSDRSRGTAQTPNAQRPTPNAYVRLSHVAWSWGKRPTPNAAGRSARA